MAEPDIPFQDEDVIFQDEDVIFERKAGAPYAAGVFAGPAPGSLNWAIAQADPRRAPLVVATLQTLSGVRVFCASGLTDTELWSEQGAQADGTYRADGSIVAGAQLLPVIAVEPSVLSYGVMRDTGSILPTIALRGRRAREVGNVELVLRNDADQGGRLLADDVVLGGILTMTVGFRGLRRDEFATAFVGVVQEAILTKEQLALRAETA